MSVSLVSQGSITSGGSPSYGAAPGSGNLLVGYVGSNGGSASFTTTTSAPGWALAASGGSAFGWSSVWYKADSAGGDASPVFTDSAGAVIFSQLAEYSGIATASPVDQSGGAVTSGGLPAWEVVLSPDTLPGDLLVASGFWNGANAGATVQVIQFTDSTGTDITPNLQYADGGDGTYLASLWGVTSETGSAGDIAWMNVSIYNGGSGAVASFKAAGAVTGTLAIAPQALPATWDGFPYVSRVLVATGGAPAYTFTVSAGSLPTGMSLSSAGKLTGANVTPAGSYGFTVQVTDGNSNTATAGQSVTVNAAPSGTTLTTASGVGASLPPGGAYSDPAICPASNGSNSYIAANWVQPLTYTQAIGAYSPSVFYVSADGAPPGTGQVQGGPGYFQVWTSYSGGHHWDGSAPTPLSVFSALTATFDATDPLTGSYELEFDIWTGYTSTNIPGTGNAQDIMIWMDTTPERSISTGVTNVWHRDVTIGVHTFDVYGDPFGGEIIFALQGPGGTGTFARVTSGTMDILGVLNWCIDQGLNLGNPPILNSVYFGWEICNTDTFLGSGTTQTENFIANSFTYNWTYSAPPPAPFSPPLVNRVVTVPVRAG